MFFRSPNLYNKDPDTYFNVEEKYEFRGHYQSEVQDNVNDIFCFCNKKNETGPIEYFEISINSYERKIAIKFNGCLLRNLRNKILN